MKTCLRLFIPLSFLLICMTVSAYGAETTTDDYLSNSDMIMLLPKDIPSVTQAKDNLAYFNSEFGAVNNRYKWRLEKTPESIAREIIEKTESLIKGKSSDRDKVFAIYSWVSDNIAYDHVAFSYVEKQLEGNQLTDKENQQVEEAASSLYAFANKRAICDGYSDLVCVMLDIAGIPNGYIGGESQNDVPHAWNAALINGKWVIFDATWSKWDISATFHNKIEYINGSIGANTFSCTDRGNWHLLFGGIYDKSFSVVIPDHAKHISISIGEQSNAGDYIEGFVFPENIDISISGELRRIKTLTIPNVGGWDSLVHCCPNLVEAILPQGIREISAYAFPGHSLLEKVVLPESVTYIEAGAFENCNYLSEIQIPNSVTIIGDRTFRGCSNLKSMSLPGGLTEIGDQAFSGCSNLMRLELPEGLLTIGTKAFSSCSALPSLTIPKSVTKIGSQAFDGCSLLKSLTFLGEPVIDYYETIFRNIRADLVIEGQEHGMIWKTAQAWGIDFRSGDRYYRFSHPDEPFDFVIPDTVTKVTREDVHRFGYNGGSPIIPSHVVAIGEGAFTDKDIGNVTIPKTVTTIESFAFSRSDLKEATLEGNIENLGEYVFSECENLAYVSLPEGFHSIAKAMFRDCHNLRSIQLPSGLKTIEEYGFANCSRLSSIVIPEGVTTIESDAFSGCASLVSVAIPDSVVDIHWSAFKYCDARLTIYGNPGSLAEAYAKKNGFPFAAGYPGSIDTVEYIATENPCTITIDGTPVNLTAYALKDANGNLINYVKLRDIAAALNGSQAQFDVGWEKGVISLNPQMAYQMNGSEFTSPFFSDQPYDPKYALVKLLKRNVGMLTITLTDSNGGGYTYFKLRDLGKALDFQVTWNGQEGICIDTTAPYSP